MLKKMDFRYVLSFFVFSLMLFIVSCTQTPGETPDLEATVAVQVQQTISAAETHSAPTETPTTAPLPVCTPPACQADEVYYCGGDCPGGCGTTCATITPSSPPATAVYGPYRITFAPGAISQNIQGTASEAAMTRYSLRALGGQQMTLNLGSSILGLEFAVSGADGVVLHPRISGVSSWQGMLPSTQDYNIDIFTPAAASFLLDITVVFVDTPQPPPSEAPERVQFQPGAIFAERSGQLLSGQTKAYILRAGANQTMNVLVTAPNAQVDLLIQQGNNRLNTFGVFDGAQNSYVAERTITLPVTGDYIVRVTSPASNTVATPYTVRFTIN